MGDRFDMRLYNDVTEDITSNGWIDVTLELADRIFMIWNSECTLQGELEELDNGL